MGTKYSNPQTKHKREIKHVIPHIINTTNGEDNNYHGNRGLKARKFNLLLRKIILSGSSSRCKESHLSNPKFIHFKLCMATCIGQLNWIKIKSSYTQHIKLNFGLYSTMHIIV